MEQRQQRFSRSGAMEIQNEFERATAPIIETLDSVKVLVETLREWWKGDSADTFVEESNKMRSDVEREIRTWLEANKNLIRSIEEIKFSGDRLLSNAMRS